MATSEASPTLVRDVLAEVNAIRALLPELAPLPEMPKGTPRYGPYCPIALALNSDLALTRVGSVQSGAGILFEAVPADREDELMNGLRGLGYRGVTTTVNGVIGEGGKKVPGGVTCRLSPLMAEFDRRFDAGEYPELVFQMGR